MYIQKYSFRRYFDEKFRYFPCGDWDEIVWQVEPVLEDPGGYDALANASNLVIEIEENVYGFSVSFDWLGTGDPGSQFYEIIDPGDFHTIEDGYTVPEPATLFLLGLGSVVCLRKRPKQKLQKIEIK